jgi:hypothetical protein
MTSNGGACLKQSRLRNAKPLTPSTPPDSVPRKTVDVSDIDVARRRAVPDHKKSQAAKAIESDAQATARIVMERKLEKQRMKDERHAELQRRRDELYAWNALLAHLDQRRRDVDSALGTVERDDDGV